MSLTLELSPMQENELQAAAQREGLPVNDYAHQLFATALQQRIPVRPMSRGKIMEPHIDEPQDWKAEPQWKTRLQASQRRIETARLASGISEAEIEADIDAAIKAHRSNKKLSQKLKEVYR